MKFKHNKYHRAVVKTKDKKVQFINGLAETNDKDLIKALKSNPDVEEIKEEGPKKTNKA